MVLAGTGKSWDQFRADDVACRQAASAEVARTEGGGDLPLQYRYDMVYMQCMYAKGHQIPTPGRAPAGASSSTTTAPPVAPGTPTAAPVPWPPPPQIECELNGGVWRAALSMCEIPRPR